MPKPDHPKIKYLEDGNINIEWPTRYHVEEISDVLTLFWKNDMAKLTDIQKASIETVRSMLKQDHLDGNRMDPWDDIDSMFQALNDIFFSGCIGSLSWKIENTLVNQGEWGYIQGTKHHRTDTRLERIKDEEDVEEGIIIRVALHDFLNNPVWPLRVQARARFLAIVCHEMLHAIFQMFVCGCKDCIDVNKELLFDNHSHGICWEQAAKAMSEVFLRVFGDLIIANPGDPDIITEPIKQALLTHQPGTPESPLP